MTTNRKTYADKRSAICGARQLGLDPATLDFVQRGERWTWAVKADAADDLPDVQANEIEDADEADDAEWHRKAAEADAVGRKQAARAAAEAARAAADAAETARIAAQRVADAAAFETTRISPETMQPAEPGPARVADGAVRPDGLRAGTKLALLADTICRPAGATHGELCQVVGWSACLPMAMKACATAGVSLRKEKEGRHTRYFGTPKAR